jgi:cytochrome oxidase Cu insertion factor (SCO1/SenC/PrrC family)
MRSLRGLAAAVFTLTLILQTWAPRPAAAQEMQPHTCDATLISLLYLAEHDYGFTSPTLDLSTFAKGQFQPLFDALMSMGMDANMPTPVPVDPMMDSSMAPLPVVALPNEDPACTTLRTELDAFLAAQWGLQSAETAMSSTAPAWQQLPLVNAVTGESFTLADFAGRTVFVEPFATWCPNCRSQLANVEAARSLLNRQDVVFVALSVETDLDPSVVAQYAANNGFNLTFAIVSPELLAELTMLFGVTIANPPSTPHFIIRPDGSTTSLVTGIESAEQIVAQITTVAGS